MIDDRPPETLAHLDLVAEGAEERGRPDGRQVLAGIALSTPLLYRALPEDVSVPVRRHAADVGAQLVGFHCSAQLDPLPRGQVYGSLDLEVALPPSCRVVAFPDDPPTATGLHGSRFVHHFEANDGRTVEAHAILESPAGTVTLTGELTCRVDVHRQLTRRFHQVPLITAKAASFAERIPTGRAVRLVISVDMKGYGARDRHGTERAQERLARIVDAARLATRAAVEDRQEQGDGILFVFPPAIDESVVLRAFYAELAKHLREVNLDLNADAAVRLRIGVDRGLTLRGASGWTGHGPITAGRLQACRETRHALDGAPDAAFVLTVSDALYRDVFADRGQIPAGTSFTPAEVRIPAKDFAARAWVHVADGAG